MLLCYGAALCSHVLRCAPVGDKQGGGNLVAFKSFMWHIWLMRKVQTSETRRRKHRLRGVRHGRSGLMTTALQAIGGISPKDRVELVSTGHRIEVPAPLTDVMTQAAILLADGRNVVVMADDEMITTQTAAKLLNVSRQYIVRLIDRGDLPATMVGSHRRLFAVDVEEYRKVRDAERGRALDQLAHLSEELGGYNFGD